jgi:hypothetical protein
MDRMWFVQTNGEIYVLEDRFATKVASKAEGNFSPITQYLSILGYFGRTLIPDKTKKAFFYKSEGNEIWKIDLNRDRPYYPTKVLEFSTELAPCNIVDYAIDFETKIAYAVSKEGHVIGSSLYSWTPKNKMPNSNPKKEEPSDNHNTGLVNFSLEKKSKNKTALKMFKSDKFEKTFHSCTLSRKGKYLVALASKRVNKKIIKHYVYVYKLSRGHDLPEIYARTEFATKWKGSKPPSISPPIFITDPYSCIERDNISHVDMKVTINGDYLLFGVTMSTGLVYCWVLKDGILYPALEKTRIHRSKFHLGVVAG